MTLLPVARMTNGKQRTAQRASTGRQKSDVDTKTVLDSNHAIMMMMKRGKRNVEWLIHTPRKKRKKKYKLETLPCSFINRVSGSNVERGVLLCVALSCGRVHVSHWSRQRLDIPYPFRL